MVHLKMVMVIEEDVDKPSSGWWEVRKFLG